jgi:hypothetical protein
MSAATNNFFFAKKKNGPRKPEMFYIKFDCYYLNLGRTRTLSVLPAPCRPLVGELQRIFTHRTGREVSIDKVRDWWCNI